MDDVEKAESTVTRPSSTSPARWPSTCVGVDDVAPPPRRGRRRASRPCPRRGTSGARLPAEVRDAVAVLRERRRGAADRRALPRAQARARRHRLRRPGRARRAARLDVPQVGEVERRAVPGRAARRVPGHVRGPAAAARARCSRRRARRCRSPPSATRTSRSTAGAGRARPPCTGSRRTSPTPEPARAGAAPVDRAGATTARSSPWPTTSPRRCAVRARVAVASLAARAGAGAGTSHGHALDDRRGRGRAVAAWVAAPLAARRPGPAAPPRCCAASARSSTRSSRRCAARGCPTRSSASAGCCHTPEVVDLVALLWVVQDPTRGDPLMRLLTGPSCRLGAADLDGLGAWAARPAAHRRGDPAAPTSAPDASDAREHRRGARRPPARDLGR